MFGHHYVAKDDEPVSGAHLLQSLLEAFPGGRGIEIGAPLIATEREEVLVPALLVADESRGQGREDTGVASGGSVMVVT